jgi:hypothetical protein
MNDIAISVKNLTKKYRIFGHPGDRIKQALTLGVRECGERLCKLRYQKGRYHYSDGMISRIYTIGYNNRVLKNSTNIPILSFRRKPESS